jgi:hypothetical protein
MARKVPVRIIDADASNPDVARLFSDIADCDQVNLREEGGWLRIATIAEQVAPSLSGGAIVLNLPSNLAHSFPEQRRCMFEALKALEFHTTLVWVLDTGVDGVNLLAGGFQPVTSLVSHKLALRNLFWGTHDAFDVWQNSRTRERFLAIGREADFPRLWPKLAERLRLTGDASLLRSRSPEFGLAEFFTMNAWIRQTDELWDSLRPEMLAA